MSYGGTLRVLPRGTAMVPHYETQGTIRRFHGWKHDASLHEGVVDQKDPKTGKVTQVKATKGGFVKLEASADEHVIDVPHTVEYHRHLRDGDLWAADLETAQLVGVKFDPTFGGEHAIPSADEAKERARQKAIADAEKRAADLRAQLGELQQQADAAAKEATALAAVGKGA